MCISTISYDDIVGDLQNRVGIMHSMHIYTYVFLIAPEILGNGWILKDEDYNIEKAKEVCDLISNDEKSTFVKYFEP